MKEEFSKILKQIRSYFSTAGFYLAAVTDPNIQRCKDFQSQFLGAFDWVPTRYCTASGLAMFVIETLLGFAGVAAVIFIILGGFWYLTSAGNEEQAEKGRKALINAVIGLVVVLLAEMIVRIVANTVGSAQ